MTDQPPSTTRRAASARLANRTSTPKPGNQPVHHIRHGAVSASIWRQETERGAMFNVTFQRSYKDGEEWRTSSVFGKNNLLVLGFVAARAFEWIGNQPQSPEA